MVVYKITNNINNKIYIGQSKNYIKRFKKHKNAAELGVKKRLYDAMRCYGEENFVIEVLCECLNKEDMNEKEIYWIKELDTLHPNGYNMTLGGDGGHTLLKWSDEDRDKLYKSQALKRTGSKRSEASKKKMSESAKLREASKSPEEKKILSEKISKINKDRGIQPPSYTFFKKGEKSGFSGNKHSEETKTKIGLARLGLKYEDYMSEDVASLLREKKKNDMLGEKNFNYVNFSYEMKKKMFDSLLNDTNINLSELEKITGVSAYKIREYLKSLGVDNFQVFKREPQDIKIQMIEGWIKNV